jgi:hypothetical protein
VGAPIDLELFRTSAVFAGAIACDAIVFTVCDFEANSRARRALRWALWVTVAHWGLAAVGLSGLWTLRAALPALAPYLQVATVLLLCALIAQLFWQSRNAARAGRPEGQLDFAAKVWIVSVDALFVGAGESAAAGSWSREQVLGVLALLGPMIFACLVGSVVLARFVSRVVSRKLVRAESVGLGCAIGLPVVALPIFGYLLFCAIRGLPLAGLD